MPEVKINVLHTLENFREAYDDEASVVVLEAVANALDAKATKLDVGMGNRHISFRDNGPGMGKKQFYAYHDISASSKRKGAGIGFAGVGAKVYLAVWKQTVIHTEGTCLGVLSVDLASTDRRDYANFVTPVNDVMLRFVKIDVGAIHITKLS